ncbi:MAG: sugar phosphate isomerase/epimerase [Firmicutes bacterium]|nr:sugar phosphate isomerase/epimerase [Bacillota bacterium]
MQLGIRLHDVNSKEDAALQTLETRAKKAREEGFACVHLALQKVIKGVTFDDAALTEGLACYVRRVFAKEDLDIAVLGCYLNLANPDPEKLAEIKSRYFAHLRVASLMGACMVGTETGAPNLQYKPEPACRSEEALETLIRNLADVVQVAEDYGVTMAIEPVRKHIVYDADRAVKVLKTIASPNLRIIFDPVNLLDVDNVDDRERVIGDAMDKLCDKIAMVHIKDFVRGEVNGKPELISVAAGCGEMKYDEILRFMKARKPYIHASLENTVNENAVQSRELIQGIYDSL